MLSDDAFIVSKRCKGHSELNVRPGHQDKVLWRDWGEQECRSPVCPTSGGWVSIPSSQGLVIRPWTAGWWLLLLWHLLLAFLLPDIQEDGQKNCIWILNVLPKTLHFVPHLSLYVVANGHSLTPKALASAMGSVGCNLSECRWWGKSGKRWSCPERVEKEKLENKWLLTQEFLERKMLCM